jgi:hypothetical protein
MRPIVVDRIGRRLLEGAEGVFSGFHSFRPARSWTLVVFSRSLQQKSGSSLRTRSRGCGRQPATVAERPKIPKTATPETRDARQVYGCPGEFSCRKGCSSKGRAMVVAQQASEPLSAAHSTPPSRVPGHLVRRAITVGADGYDQGIVW